MGLNEWQQQIPPAHHEFARWCKAGTGIAIATV